MNTLRPRQSLLRCTWLRLLRPSTVRPFLLVQFSSEDLLGHRIVIKPPDTRTTSHEESNYCQIDANKIHNSNGCLLRSSKLPCLKIATASVEKKIVKSHKISQLSTIWYWIGNHLLLMYLLHAWRNAGYYSAFAFFAGMISFPSVVLLFWVAIWIKPIERFLFHALKKKTIEMERKRIFMAFEILLNLICWRESYRVGKSSNMHISGRVALLTFRSSTYFECQTCLWKNFSIISWANTREQWHLTSLSHHKHSTCPPPPMELRNTLSPFTIPSFYFPTRFECQHVPFCFCSRINSKNRKHCLELYFKISVVRSTFSDSFCTATACRRLLRETQSIPLSALLSFYSSEWLIIIERFCELPIVLKLKRLLLSSKPPGDGLKVKIFARVLFLEDTQHLMIASVPQSWLWRWLACFIRRFSLTGCLSLWFQVIFGVTNCSDSLGMMQTQAFWLQNLQNSAKSLATTS